MLTQPSILMLQGGTWVPLPRNLWTYAGVLGDAEAIVKDLISLGVADAQVIDMTSYTGLDGNFHNDFPAMFMYQDQNVRLWAALGQVQQATAADPNLPALPLYEPTGALQDRLTNPSVLLGDRPAVIVQGPTGNKKPYPNGAQLVLLPYPAESYATCAWTAK